MGYRFASLHRLDTPKRLASSEQIGHLASCCICSQRIALTWSAAGIPCLDGWHYRYYPSADRYPCASSVLEKDLQADDHGRCGLTCRYVGRPSFAYLGFGSG